MLIRIVDIESTGLPPDSEADRKAARVAGTYPVIVEIGWHDLNTAPDLPPAQWALSGPASYLVNPGRPIPPEASAVHHIIDEDVKDAPTRDAIRPLLLANAEAFAAHQASFERAFFAGDGKPWICTLKAARRIWPDAPGHSVQVLRYWLALPANRQAATPAHRAQPDAYVTALLLRRLFEAGATIEQMIEWTELPSLLPQVTFGKHRGKPWSELPLDYLDWLISKSEMDEDTKFTARHWLKKGVKQ